MKRQWTNANVTTGGSSSQVVRPQSGPLNVDSTNHLPASASSSPWNSVGRPASQNRGRTTPPSAESIDRQVPLGRVPSTPPSNLACTRHSTAGSGGANHLHHQQRSGICTTGNYSNSPTKKLNMIPHTRSFDEKQGPPSLSVAVTNLRRTASSSPPEKPKMSSATSSTTSSTASISSNEEENYDVSLYGTNHTRNATTAPRKQQQKQLHRSLSSDSYNNFRHFNTNSDATDGTVMWMESIISSNQASSPPQDMKLTSVRKRPSPRNECDHHHYDHYTNFTQRSSPPSSSSLFLQLQQQQQQQQQQSSMVQAHLAAGTSTSSAHTPSASSSTMVTSFRNSLQQNKSGSFRRRKGTKKSMGKSLLRNKSFLLLRYMYLQRYFSTKRRSVFILCTIGTVLLLLFILSFSLSFLSSHRNTITKMFFASMWSDKMITPTTGAASVAVGNRNDMMVPKPWSILSHRDRQPTGKIDSSNNNPSTTVQNYQQDSAPGHGAVTTISSTATNNNKVTSNTVIHTLRGRFKKHNLITQQKTTAVNKDQSKKPYKWFGFSHLLLPPKKKLRQVETITGSPANDTEITNISPIVVDGKVYNFQQYTNYAPHCDTTISENDIDFTIATQLSYNRLWMMEHHCFRWTHAMSLAIYIGNDETTTITRDSIRQEMIQMGCSEQQDITVQVLSGYSDEEYPVNVLRNMALSKVKTTHVVYVDVDFWVSIDLHSILNQHRATLLSNSKLALVIPAFQLSRQCKEWRDCREVNIPKMPHNKDELVDLMMKHQANAFDPSNRGGHGSTRYKDWLLQQEDELIPIDCVKSNRYEPYLVFRLCNVLPPFQESFTGYGKNKMTWMMQLRRTGYELMQLGGAFAVHYPHLDSTARMHWNGGADGSQLPKPHDTKIDLSKFKRGQIDETFVAFRHWLATSIPDNSVMPMCDDAQDDDQRLWIAPEKVIKVKSI